jgi:Holliday junction resolvasome RuvABC endonuclease subunit
VRAIGIDPGLRGGIAVVSDSDEPEVIAMPGGYGAIVVWLRNRFRIDACAIEKQHARPTDGRNSAFTLGRGYGALLASLQIAGVEYVEVEPKEWQAAFEIKGDTKAQSIAEVQARWPDLSLLATLRSRKPHDGMADAVLIAQWALDRALGVKTERKRP